MDNINNSQNTNSKKPRFWFYSASSVFVVITVLVVYQLMSYDEVLFLSTGIAAILLFNGINGTLKFYYTTSFLSKKEKKKCFYYSVFYSFLLSGTAGLAIYIDKLAGGDELAVFILITSVFMLNKISRKIHAYLLLDTKKKKAQLQAIIFMAGLIFVFIIFFFAIVPSGILSFGAGVLIFLAFYKDIKSDTGRVNITIPTVILLLIAVVLAMILFYMIISGETFIIDRSFLEIKK